MNYEKVIHQIKCYLQEEWNMVGNEQDKENSIDRSGKALLLKEAEAESARCTKCDLYKTATNLVYSDGDPDAEIVIIGEAPGADEDAQGKPFVGRAGKLLTAAIEEMGLPRKRVYICNILKHRPPENRNPLPNEIEACTPYLVRQLEILKPKLIITLGNFSTKFMLNTEEGITKLRGQVRKSHFGYPVIPTYHPAAVLRNMNLITDLKADIKAGLEFINKIS